MPGERMMLNMVSVGPQAIISPNPCDGCPGNRGCCGGEKAQRSPLAEMIKNSLPLKKTDILSTPQFKTSSFGTINFSKVETVASDTVSRGSEPEHGMAGPIQPRVEQSTCKDCGEKYNSNQSCQHNTASKDS